MSELRAQLDAVPRLGWIDAPSPVTAAPALAEELGLAWLGFKRDDRIPRLHGGSKVRKLDVLLATGPFADAPGWASWGAIGSGHLVALSAAARELGKRLVACTFWQPPASTCWRTWPTWRPVPARSCSTAAASGWPSAGRSGGRRHGPRAPGDRPGGDDRRGHGRGRPGRPRAGSPDRGRELPAPDRIVLPIGSAGTTVGLLLGLGLAGLRPRVHAVAAVERWFVLGPCVRRFVAQARAWLVQHGVPAAADVELPPLQLDPAWVGPGYGIASPASQAACRRLAEHGLTLEEVYSGKAMAALLAAPPPASACCSG